MMDWVGISDKPDNRFAGHLSRIAPGCRRAY
ncbi:MAG: hypothetical protein ACI89D_002767 [Bermanella sp.]